MKIWEFEGKLRGNLIFFGSRLFLEMPAEKSVLTYWYIIRKLEVLVENWWTKTKKESQGHNIPKPFLGRIPWKKLGEVLGSIFRWILGGVIVIIHKEIIRGNPRWIVGEIPGEIGGISARNSKGIILGIFGRSFWINLKRKIRNNPF